MNFNRDQKFVVDVLTPAELHELINCDIKTATSVRDGAMIATCYYAQLRCNEALSLRPFDIDWQAGALTVVRGKGGKRRVVGIPIEKLNTILGQWNKIRPNHEYFFSTNRGNRVANSYFRNMIKRRQTKCGIKKRVHVHGLRHSGAFALAGHIQDLRIIQRQLGHSSLNTTDRYVNHLRPEATIQAVNSAAWE